MKAVVKKSPIQQQGFTLIELVVVIVILGILAATAAPKFIDLSSDAESAGADSVKGSMESVATLANAKWLVSGEGATISAGGVTIDMVNGYPAADDEGTNNGIESLLDLDGMSANDSTGALVVTYEGCTITYTETTDSDVRPSIAKSCP